MTAKTYEERREVARAWRTWLRDEALAANAQEPPVIGCIPAEKARGKDAEWYRTYTPQERATLERINARMRRIPEYFNPLGAELWHGRGRAPAWWLEAIDAGYTPDQMRIVSMEAA